tara:strand:- start:550 stop:711 length:162 start_codon:yes stop_codon:yes gene_type:complete
MELKKKIKKTDCCDAYSTYHDEILICKKCFKGVELGQGDGTEFIYVAKWEGVE